MCVLDVCVLDVLDVCVRCVCVRYYVCYCKHKLKVVWGPGPRLNIGQGTRHDLFSLLDFVFCCYVHR